MSESIIVGVVVGVVVAGIGAVISHFVRKREMDRLWAEEERRRKSDRRRETREGDLRIVRDAVDAITGAVDGLGRFAWLYEEEQGKSRAKLVLREVGPMIMRGHLMALSLKDRELLEKYEEAMYGFRDWFNLLDVATGKAAEGKEEDFQKHTTRTLLAASKVWDRIREIWEEL